MSLLDDISTDLVNESTSLSNTLRKAKILASTIGIQEFRDWVDSELTGYRDMSKLPDYRRFPGLNFGTYSGPYQSRADHVVLPIFNLPDVVKKFAENLFLPQGVRELEGMLTNSGEQYKLNWPQEYVILARDSLRMSNGMVLVAAHQPITPHLLSGILDNVKNKLLDFLLGLEENNFTLEDFKSGTITPETVRNLFFVNVYGNNNVVASGEHVYQQSTAIERGDIESLLSRFRELGIDEESLNELKDALSTEPTLSDGGYGPRVREWIGGLISKAAVATGKSGLGQTSEIIMDTLNKFYGLSA